MQFLTLSSRLLVGLLFIVSGLIKANDALGFSYKLEEYFSSGVLNMEFLIPYSFLLAAGICVAEIVLGVMVLIGARPKFTSFSLLGMIVSWFMPLNLLGCGLCSRARLTKFFP